MTRRVGDPVRTVAHGSGGHTRLPAYLRGKPGRIEAVHGRYPLADERAAGRRVEQLLLTVAFRASDVWGAGGEPNLVLHAELWESYLAE